jgi:hypothetical protein
MRLYRLSEKNRMLFYYLDKLRTVSSYNGARGFSFVYESENTRRLKIDDAISRVSGILSEMHVQHAVFKTIRPYKCTTVDIDVIVFEGYARAGKAMRNEGYSLIVQGPMSTTIWDQKASIGIDLYDEVAVSSITYIDKRKLVDSIVDTKLPNDRHVKTLKPETDLACIIGHSVLKEQMYTLAEYYSFIHYLRKMDINNFIQTIKKCNLISAAKTHATLTALLHKTAHGNIPDELQQILKVLGQEPFEATRLQRAKFETPHKYHLITIGRSLLEITKEKQTRRSLGKQLLNMFNSDFTSDFLKKLLDHVFRQTY